MLKAGKEVVEADAGGDSESPGAGLQDGAADARAATKGVGERSEATALEAEDGASLRGEDAVVGGLGEEAALSLDAEVLVEVAGDADDGSGIDWLVLVVVDVAVDGAEIAVAAEEVEA